ncbi:DUF2508 family protein [Agrilactobacillus fermenti]|uniref:DUF2508 family protein n=1 Tax=Agrilactobacillus fermenti TaxID=2586909 RepID=UPI001E587115|nr:DUF2508 family protein [Agrilactobacillus fermenti]MCD2255444.1 DUF2508 family protein [Agrilactobacillus fermenti]
MGFFRNKKTSIRQQADQELLDLAFVLREEILSYTEVDSLAVNGAGGQDPQLLLQKAKYDYIYKEIRRRRVSSKRIAPDMFQ